MLEFCGRRFTCDECPICEGIEHRLRAAREGGYEPQLEYCGCDKVQTEFFISGYPDIDYKWITYVQKWGGWLEYEVVKELRKEAKRSKNKKEEPDNG